MDRESINCKIKSYVKLPAWDRWVWPARSAIAQLLQAGEKIVFICFMSACYHDDIKNVKTLMIIRIDNRF